jgi:hypothetical protein
MLPGRALSSRSRSRFLHLKDLITTDVFERLTNPARPVNFDCFGHRLGSQAEICMASPFKATPAFSPTSLNLPAPILW